MPYPGTTPAVGSAGAAGSMHRGPAQAPQQGHAYPAGQTPGQAPTYGQYYGTPPAGHYAGGGPPQAWGPMGAPNQTPLGVGYDSDRAAPPGGRPVAPNAPRAPQGAAPRQPGGAQLSDQTVLDGPAVPPELRGRTFGQVKRVYTALANDWLKRRNQGQQPNGRQGPQGQPGQGQPGPGQPGQGQPGQSQPGFSAQSQQAQPGQGAPAQGQPNRRFGYDPDAGFGNQQGQGGETDIAHQVKQAVQQAMAPIHETNLTQASVNARGTAAQNIPDFAELEGDIMQIMSDASPQVRADPRSWEAAADVARGRRSRPGQPQPGQPRNIQRQPQPPTQPQVGMAQPAYGGQPVNPAQNPAAPAAPATPGGAPPAYGGQPSAPAPGYPSGFSPYGGQSNPMGNPSYVPANPGSFFAEGPSSPTVTADVGLSPQEQVVARQFKMTPEQYAQWKGVSNGQNGGLF